VTFFNRHILVFILVLNLCFSITKAQTNPNGFNKFYYDNGKVSSEGNMRDGKPDGYWKTYAENGTIKNEGNN